MAVASVAGPDTGGVAAQAVVRACDLGRVEYDEGLVLQRRLADARKDGRLDRDLLLLLEHPPVITYGRNTADGHVLASPEALDASGVPRVEIDRGGDVTYHGPGQLVGYPILDLAGYRKDLHWYLRRVEESLIRALAVFELPAARVEGLTGVWVGDWIDADAGPDGDAVLGADVAASRVASGALRKIASIGIHASRWVTTHGFALNRTAEALSGFRWIVPCGIEGVTVTSLESEGRPVSAGALRDAVVRGFATAFAARLESGPLPVLDDEARP